MQVPLPRREARDHHGLLLRVLADAVRAVTGAQTRVLPAAHRHLERDIVHLGSFTLTAPDSMRRATARPWRCPRSRSTPGGRTRVVREPDRLLGILDLHDRERRPEGLLAHALHRVVDVDQHRGLEEMAVASRRMPPTATLAPFLAASFTCASTMSACGGLVTAPTSTLPGPPCPDAVRRPCRSRAARTRRTPAPPRRRARPRCRSARRSAWSSTRRRWRRSRGQRQRDDHRVLATELERHGRQRPRRPVHHLLAGLRGAGERPKSTASISAAPVSPPSPPGRRPRQPALAQHLGHQHRGQRRDLARLEHHGVAGRQRRDAVSERVGERVVPGADHADHAERAAAHHELARLTKGARPRHASSARYSSRS